MLADMSSFFVAGVLITNWKRTGKHWINISAVQHCGLLTCYLYCGVIFARVTCADRKSCFAFGQLCYFAHMSCSLSSVEVRSWPTRFSIVLAIIVSCYCPKHLHVDLC